MLAHTAGGLMCFHIIFMLSLFSPWVNSSAGKNNKYHKYFARDTQIFLWDVEIVLKKRKTSVYYVWIMIHIYTHIWITSEWKEVLCRVSLQEKYSETYPFNTKVVILATWYVFSHIQGIPSWAGFPHPPRRAAPGCRIWPPMALDIDHPADCRQYFRSVGSCTSALLCLSRFKFLLRNICIYTYKCMMKLLLRCRYCVVFRYFANEV